MRISVCTRPFRPAGPRLEAEAIDGKTIVHNYGHGGSGWSLSWGCAAEAAQLALSGGAQRVAVIGAGAIGLTTARTLIERGVAVTIYAKEFPAETRSARATGLWSPASRIALTSAVASGFAERWQNWARTSHATHQNYVGVLSSPVEYLTQFDLHEDNEPSIHATHDFIYLSSRVGLQSVNHAPGEHPFPVARASSRAGMVFNIASYQDHLTRDFLLRGGRMVRRDFANRQDVLTLPETVIVNCSGFGAAQLWDDRDLVPVRGQINWLAPQPNARYGLFYNQVQAVSRSDGVIVQYVGPNEDFGYGDASEAPNRDEMTDALARLAPLFA